MWINHKAKVFSANQITFRHSILYTDYPGVHFAALRWTLHVEESDKRRSILLLYKIESYFLRPWHYYDVDADFTVILFRTRIVLGGCRMLGGQYTGWCPRTVPILDFIALSLSQLWYSQQCEYSLTSDKLR